MEETTTEGEKKQDWMAERMRVELALRFATDSAFGCGIRIFSVKGNQRTQLGENRAALNAWRFEPAVESSTSQRIVL